MSSQTDKTDAELIAALGWECEWDHPSALLGDGLFCVVHEEPRWGGADWCIRVQDRLDGVRAGIDLARNGIADAIQQEYLPGDRWSHGLRQAAKIAKGWGT